ncbi:hypothetical protein APX01_19555 (plasmid) [Cereibacter sphaeroides]|nr:hypothetical protein APX01_19555 [Cereibacter sphaeroides]
MRESCTSSQGRNALADKAQGATVIRAGLAGIELAALARRVGRHPRTAARRLLRGFVVAWFI